MSSVTTIERYAFSNCTNLQSVKFCEGVQDIEGGAFLGCTSLPQINIPSPAFVIGPGALTCSLSRSGTIPNNQHRGTIHYNIYPKHSMMIISKHVLNCMSSSCLTQAENRINEILSTNTRTRKDNLERVRGLIAYYELVEATTILELAIWKANMGARENDQQDDEARQACRQNCGADMNVIVKLVLQYFKYNM